MSLPLTPIRSRCGDRLLEIMDVDGPWRLELDAPEFRMGHLHQAVIARSTSPPTKMALSHSHREQVTDVKARID